MFQTDRRTEFFTPCYLSSFFSLSARGPTRRRNSTGLAELWGGWPIERVLVMSDGKCKSNFVSLSLSVVPCSECHSGTDIKIGGRQLQRWAGLNFRRCEFPAILRPFFAPAKSYYVHMEKTVLNFACADRSCT